MCIYTQNNIRDKARINRGLLGILTEDINMLNTDINNFNLIDIDESIRRTKLTLIDIIDNIQEIECMITTLKK